MGVYWKAVNHTKRAWLDPEKIGNGLKMRSLVQGEFSRLLVFLLGDAWCGDHVVLADDAGDGESLYWRAEHDYADATADAVRRYNEWFPEAQIAYTGIT